MKYILDNDVAGNVRQIGRYLLDRLDELKRKYQFVTDVRGRGLLVAIEFDSDIGQSMLDACLEKGLLINRVKPNALRFMPSLLIGRSEVDEAIDILDEALAGTVE